jgi:sulfur carrier protein ThiS
VNIYVNGRPRQVDHGSPLLSVLDLPVGSPAPRGVAVALDGTVVPRRYLVVAPRFAARSAVLAGLGLEAEELRMGDTVLGTAVPSGPDGATSVPGVHVAGNVADLRSQVVTSAAQGLMAGARINAELVEEDTVLALQQRTERRSA